MIEWNALTLKLSVFLIYLKIDLLEIYASTMRLFYVSVCGFLSDSTLFGAWFTTMKN